MSVPALKWPGAKTTKQAAKYLLTSGFVAVEYCRALTTERDSLRARVAELEEKLSAAESLIDYAELDNDEAVESGWVPPSCEAGKDG